MKTADKDLNAILAELRRFNEAGLKAIAVLSEHAQELSKRIQALEEFQKALQTPGDKTRAS